MQSLTDDFLDRCRIQRGFRLRGEAMTRIEVFVDAAFAFAVTMLVISYESIPQTFDELVVAIKGIPAFIAAVAQLVWIWHAHSVWSERYGLSDTATVTFSAMLLIVVLIYVYPLRIMFAGMFDFFTLGLLPDRFELVSLDQLAYMFVFLGAGFIALCLIFVLMYRHALKRSSYLRLDAYELHETETSAIIWLGSAGTGLISIILALTLPDNLIPFAGFGYALLGVWIPFATGRRLRARPERSG